MKTYCRFLAGVCLSSVAGGCSEHYMSYEGGDRIQFAGKTEEVYTFAYSSEETRKDTLKIKVMTIGEVADHPRTVRFEQVTKEWEYKYAEDDPNKIVDSTYVDMKYPAVAGTHFELLDSDDGKTFVLPARKHEMTLRIAVFRNDTDLQKNARKLYIRLLPSAAFQEGIPNYTMKRIVISDKLERPTLWKDTDYECDLYLGKWSEAKHRLLINVTKEKWDNACIRLYLKDRDNAALRYFYLQKVKRALAAYNADPNNNPPLKDENGDEVTFP